MNYEAKNIIYFGPPGTGKTYEVIRKAVALVEPGRHEQSTRQQIEERYKQLTAENKIAFCTFHQSFSYEDFVEGLRSDETGKFTPADGILRQICRTIERKRDENIEGYNFDPDNITFYKISLGYHLNPDEVVFEHCIANNCIALGYGLDVDYTGCTYREQIRSKYLQHLKSSKKILDQQEYNVFAIERFMRMEEGDLVFVPYGNRKVRAIGKVVGKYEYKPDTEINFNHFRNVEWLYTGEPIDVDQMMSKNFSTQTIYTLSRNALNISYIQSLLSTDALNQSDEQKYVLIIDEINRGNISKVFGELITLIEEDKRIGESGEIRVQLPYSNEKLGIPKNLHIIGTMNTADRSIALLDTALRRRFSFTEVLPDATLLPTDIGGVNLQSLLSGLNVRLEYLLSRDHMIGHAYFMRQTLDFAGLVEIMQHKIIPLLQEYFYEDWEKIELILGGTGDQGNESYFLWKEETDHRSIFGNVRGMEDMRRTRYGVVEHPSAEAFQRIYPRSGA